MMATNNPIPSTPVKTVKEQADGLSPVSIFADLVQETPFKKQSTTKTITTTSPESKAKASRRGEVWDMIHTETKGDWDAMHAALQQQLTGKVELDWAIPVVAPKEITLQPPTKEEYTSLATKMKERLEKNITRTRSDKK